jgi:hypothetical protein
MESKERGGVLDLDMKVKVVEFYEKAKLAVKS